VHQGLRRIKSCRHLAFSAALPAVPPLSNSPSTMPRWLWGYTLPHDWTIARAQQIGLSKAEEGYRGAMVGLYFYLRNCARLRAHELYLDIAWDTGTIDGFVSFGEVEMLSIPGPNRLPNPMRSRDQVAIVRRLMCEERWPRWHLWGNHTPDEEILHPLALIVRNDTSNSRCI
jgi:hypothetical protein